MGIFPYIVKKLFDKRVPVKAEFVRLHKLIEQMDLAKVKEMTIVVNGIEQTVHYKDIKFNLNKVESKQKALKVLANTFYGESGNY
jgi:DNA polymerase elongation subunit (family B)